MCSSGCFIRVEIVYPLIPGWRNCPLVIRKVREKMIDDPELCQNHAILTAIIRQEFPNAIGVKVSII